MSAGYGVERRVSGGGELNAVALERGSSSTMRFR